MLAVLLGLLLLTSGLGTWSQWRAHDELEPGSVAAGAVGLANGGHSVMLLSRQPAGTRTYTSGTTCSAPAPYVECRVITASLGTERLIPGDTIRVTRSITLTGSGDNLKGDLLFDATALLREAASPLGQATTTTVTVTTPAGEVVSGSPTVTRTVRRVVSDDFGSYQAVADLATPVTNAGARWDSALFDQSLDLGEFTVTFTQTD